MTGNKHYFFLGLMNQEHERTTLVPGDQHPKMTCGWEPEAKPQHDHNRLGEGEVGVKVETNGKGANTEGTGADSQDKSFQKVPVCCSSRLCVILCCMAAMTFTFATEASMSSAMVCMLTDELDPGENNTSGLLSLHNSTSATQLYSTSTSVRNPWKFHWNKATQGWVLSSLFMGYYASQLPSGIAAARFSPKKVVVISLVLVSILQALAVPAARAHNLAWLYADRALTGLVVGFLYAPTFALAGNWTPRQETSLMFGMVGMGMELGTMVSFAFGSIACEIDWQGGWPIIFYLVTAFGLITAFMVVVFVSDSPFDNRLIKKKELRYIASSIPKLDVDKQNSLKRIPLKDILTSKPFWSIVIAQLGSDWMFFMLISVAPMYLKEVLKLSNVQVNILSGTPFIFIIPAVLITGSICDRVVAKGLISNTNVRKINDAVSKIIPACCLLALSFLPEGSAVGAFVLNTVGAVALGFIYVGWMTNPADLAPAHTGFIAGISQVGAVWVAFVVPIFTNSVTSNKTRGEWQFAFYFTAGVQVFTSLFFSIFASGELQPWAVVDTITTLPDKHSATAKYGSNHNGIGGRKGDHG